MWAKCSPLTTNVTADLEQVEGLGLYLGYEVPQVPGAVPEEVVPHHVSVAGPVLLRRGAQHAQDPGELVLLVEAGEERLPGDELGEDAAAAPEVHRGGVCGAQQHLGGAIPQRHHLQSSRDHYESNLAREVREEINMSQILL